MRLIPVLDVREGIVVHALSGRRAGYRPLRSTLTARTDPAGVAGDLHRLLGCSELYVADLDRIERAEAAAEPVVSPGVAALVAWAGAAGVDLLVDAGIVGARGAVALAALGPVRPVIGTETLGDLGALTDIVGALGRERVLASLDLRDGLLVAASRDLATMPARDAACLLAARGVGELIVLDLARVGTARGAAPQVAAIAQACPGVAVLAGGGVRSADDLSQLEDAGAAGALVATALHTGALLPEEWRRWSAGGGR